jgi:hypothetical protein
MRDETITPLRTLEQKDLDERQRQCIELLGELLESARKGDFGGMFAVTLSADGKTFSSWMTGVPSITQAIGILEVIKAKLLESAEVA